MSVRQFEDARWRANDQKTEFRHREAVKLIGKGTALDIGCGDGLLLKLLKEKGIQAEGVDISPEGVAKCIAAGFMAKVHSVDEPLPYADGSFDTVVLLDILEHVYDPQVVLADAARVARTAVIVSVPNFSSVPARIQTMRGQVPENNRPHKGHLYWFNHPVLQSIATGTGLRIDALHMNTFSPFSKLGIPATVWPNGLALSFVARLTKDA